ncbi:hypothetical protein AV926_05470 [Myroides marinus]|uniref:Abi-like protein n=1 Tax=Myroides marinus TaxID=703342 RepID=A0A161SB68_9FLAO|nr:Abi family protein [Myroides marinus]KZE82994.1 hypothetical protein AV926_05470 [Myroides marinus]
MRISLRDKYLSSQRFNRYLISVQNDNKKAKKLYKANLRLAQAFHPLISQFEVVLRNSITNNLTLHFNDTDWIINEVNGFMNDNSLSTSNYFLKNNISKTIANLHRRRIQVTSGKVISDQSFGVWVSLFLPHHYRLLNGQIIHIFPYKPATESRASLYTKLSKIRDFRNRVNHCEPICFNQNNIDCSEAQAILDTIYDLINWIDPNLTKFFREIDNVRNKIAFITNI